MTEMCRFFEIGGRLVGNGAPCYIIAEVGSNHDKIKSRAFEMICQCAKGGADAVKFQLFVADKIAANIDLPETELNDQFARFGRSVHDLYRNMELPTSWLKEIEACCNENGVHFLATPFDERSADLLADLGVSAIKVASFEITHIPLLKHLGILGLPVLLSTGIANLQEIRIAVETVRNAGEDRIGLFHCGIGYPLPLKAVNLRCMQTLRHAFDCPVGYSDHTEGISVPLAAVGLGAALYEKHVTMAGGKSPDHDFAISMENFAQMTEAMRQCEIALGSDIKTLQESEKEYLRRGRRSLFVVKNMSKGDVFTRENLSVLRPGVGLPPVRYEKVLGKKASRNINAPALLKEEDWC